MMQDTLECHQSSIIQHGKLNDRVYIMYVHPDETETVLETSLSLANKNGYSKIFAKVGESSSQPFLEKGFSIEASIPNYFDTEACLFISLFTDKNRSQIQNQTKSLIFDVLDTVNGKAKLKELPDAPSNSIIRRLEYVDSKQLSQLYRDTFKSYPFPIFDLDYLQQSMNEHTVYFGCYIDDKLIGASSAEMDVQGYSAEMTDFAVRPEMRGKNLSVHLLNAMEKYLFVRKKYSCYTICRSVSYGMNSAFKKLGYTYSGTLVNNTNISGSIESMNVWHKTLKKKE